MDKDHVILVDGVGKKFCRSLKQSLFYGLIDLCRDFISLNGSRDFLRKNEFWSLKNIHFSVKKGEALAFVGVNGSGKSTLLRIIAGIYTPDLGRVTVRGRMGVLIALGAGFHPNMTGLENIYLNASILGLRKNEIDLRLQAIVDFAELGDFLHAPISSYSSGMTVRLGFSIASHCDADILLVDEVLAVGDLAFTLKCYRKMAEFRKNGGTTILVSHSNQLVRNVCDRAIWIDKGLVRMDGPVQQVCDAYELASTAALVGNYSGQALVNDPSACIDRLEILGGRNGAGDKVFEVGEDLIVRIHYRVEREVGNPIFAISIENLENMVICANFTIFDELKLKPLNGTGYVEFIMPKLQLKRGRYFITATFAENEINNVLSWLERTEHISISGGPVSHGIYNPYPQWIQH